MNCYFVPGIILDHFSYRKSIFGYRKVEILRNFTIVFFDSKIDFLIEKSISRLKNQEKQKKQLQKTRKNAKK